MISTVEKKDDFIGYSFVNSKGSKITVTGVSHRGRDYIKHYTCTCSVCSLDKELFQDPFTSVKGSLKKGNSPCGCATNKVYSEAQQIIRIKRECALRGLSFLGFKGAYKSPSKTMCRLSCNKHVEWDTTTVSRLFRGTGCPSCGNLVCGLSNKTDDNELVSRFIETGKFTEGTVFTKSNKVNRRNTLDLWEVTCPVCLLDEYVGGGVCTGTFESNTDALSKGKCPCRCSTRHKLPPHHADFKVRYECSKRGYTFVCWVDGYNHKDSLFNFICDEGHNGESKATPFVRRGAVCRECSKLRSDFGVIESEKDSNDFCYLLLFTCKVSGESFIKIGRTLERCYLERIRYFNRYYNTELLGINKGIHRNISVLEKEYHHHFNEYLYKPLIPFGGSLLECFSKEVLEAITLEDDGTFTVPDM